MAYTEEERKLAKRLSKKKYRENNKEKCLLMSENWRLANLSKVASNHRKQKKRLLEKDPNYFLISRVKTFAKKNHIPFSLKSSDIVIPEYCPILGIKLEKTNKVTDATPSIDRFIPEIGYVKDNINIISYKANRIKNNATIEEVSKLLDWMIKIQRTYRLANG